MEVPSDVLTRESTTIRAAKDVTFGSVRSLRYDNINQLKTVLDRWHRVQDF